jgi:hypothetical protein
MAKRKSRKTTDEHYVDNKKFLLAMQDWKKDCSIASNLNKPVPPVSDYIGECFMKIANHLSYRPNFINYTYRDEMIADGIENCIQFPFTTQKGDATEYHSPAFDEFKNMMLPEEDVYKPKNKKKSLKKKGITLGLEIFMGGNDKE